jgi:type III restriction enzyme
VRLTLRPFQEEAVADLLGKLDIAQYGYERTRGLQSVGLAAPTGSGKTVIATALIERLIFGTDEGEEPGDPEAVFLWVTDMPQLNIQTRNKMLDGSPLLGPDRLVVIEKTFDEESLEAGKVYFLNIQKLGAKAALPGPISPKRKYPFWETVRNTIDADGRHLYLVIDEAHRGMAEDDADLDLATSIVQRFIKGYDAMPPAPIMLGLSATPERFNRVVENVGRASAWHTVKPEDVRSSGLIKDRTVAHFAAEAQHDPMAVLRKAAEAFRDATAAWAAYCAGTDDPVVVPALVVQVENEDATDLAVAIGVIVDVLGAMGDAEFAHSFGDQQDITVGLHIIRYIEASKIADDSDLRVVFFKRGLGTGWDCPRAEVMFSFRRAVDPTSIAQTIGRMVRTPLARRIAEDDRLNAVDVFLPHYDRHGVQAIIDYLAASGANAAPLVSVAELVTLTCSEDPDIVAAIKTVPSYHVPTVTARKEVRRLTDLARALSTHDIDTNADAREKAWIATTLLDARATLADDATFAKEVDDQGVIEIERVEWATGADVAGDPTRVSIPASEGAISAIFAAAKRALGGEAAEAYWKARVAADPSTMGKGRLEAYALSRRTMVMDSLNAAASTRIDGLFLAHGPATAALPAAKRAIYDRVREAAPTPTQTMLDPPAVIVRRRGPITYADHLYTEATGGYPTVLNTWEAATMTPRIGDGSTVSWLRNLPTDTWALRVPWAQNNVAHPFYPDFLVVRRQDEDLVLDILDPHDHTRDDAPGKARGLSAYARAHGTLFGHIDLIAKVDGRMRVLHLESEAMRNAVDAIGDNNAALIALYRAN